MPEFEVRCVVLDIEGTTSSISFVHDEMFPFVRQHLDHYLETQWHSEELRKSLDLLAIENQGSDADSWLPGNLSVEARKSKVHDYVLGLMDEDRKSTGLKDLQGKIWKSGFESGQLVSHVYPDVIKNLEAWTASGIKLCIYSSGSIAAQKLFFGHTQHGSLLKFFHMHFDTTIGNKKEPSSYSQIVGQLGPSLQPSLFVSDVAAELDAAQHAGLYTVASIRPGNQELPANCPHTLIQSFDELSLRMPV